MATTWVTSECGCDFYRHRSLSMFFRHRTTVNVAISLLLHITQRSARFRELVIDAVDRVDTATENGGQVEFHFRHLLETNVELGILLASQLKVFHFNGEGVHCSFLDLAQTFDRLFSYSTSPPVLTSIRIHDPFHFELSQSRQKPVRTLSYRFRPNSLDV